MEETEKYKVSINGMISIQWSDEVGRLLEAVKEHLSTARWRFISNNVFIGSDKEFFQQNCVTLAIYYMLLEIDTNVGDYKHECHKAYVKLRSIGTFATRLIIIENSVEEYYRELNALNIDSEKVLSDLHKAISLLQKFLHEQNLSVR